MSLKYENGYIGNYKDRQVFVATQEYYEGHRKSFKNEFVVLVTGKDNGIYDFILNEKIVGTINDNRQVTIARDSINYDIKYKQKTISMDNRREYTYIMKDNSDDAKHHHHLSMEELAQKVSDIILDGLATGNRLLKEEQERADMLLACYQLLFQGFSLKL